MQGSGPSTINTTHSPSQLWFFMTQVNVWSLMQDLANIVDSSLQFDLGNSKIFETFVGGHRGGMKECYHGPCDIYNHKEKHKNNIQWDFLVKTTQTLIGRC